MNETISPTQEFSANALPSNHIYTVSKPATDKESFVFTGNGHDYFKIWIVNIALTILTLGIYSAWAKVRKQQYFYRNTHFDGSSFDYHATPLAILKGRIIAIAIYATFGVLSQYSLTATLIFGAVVFVFTPIMVYSSMRFNANMSSYRGVRFHFHGSLKDAFVTYLGWGLAAFASLYILFPITSQKTHRYKISNMRYGDAKFAFSAKIGDFYSLYIGVFCVFLGVVILQFAVSFILLGTFGKGARPFSTVIAYLIFAIILFPYITANLRNLVYGHTQLESDKMYSNYDTTELMKLYFGNFIGVVLTLGLYYPYATIRNAKYRCEHTGFESKKILDTVIQNQISSPTAAGEEVASIFDVDIGM